MKHEAGYRERVALETYFWLFFTALVRLIVKQINA